jgi:hypothetical protein
LIKAIIVIILVVGVLVGGLLTLRRSGRAGMPDEAKRAREQAAEEDKEDQGT